MIDGYATVKEKAEEWGIAMRTLQGLCAQGRVEGAIKFGGAWAIPNATKHVSHKGSTTGKYNKPRKSENGENKRVLRVENNRIHER